jgi:malate dehydrogenase (oxaloacetate-decarboxylating)(NADP+)
LTNYQQSYAHPHPATGDLAPALESLRPTVFIGFSTAPKAFDQRVIQTMARTNQRPIIMALSNPTSRAECTAEEAYEWSDGRAVFASGSPFPPVDYAGRTLVPSQCNNAYIFPAMGLAIYVTRARRVSDEMFLAAAYALAGELSSADLAAGLIFPPLSSIQQTQIRIAQRVAEVTFAQGLASIEQPRDVSAFVEAQLYSPE